MPANGREWAWVAALGGAIGLGGWIFYAWVFDHRRLQDWMVFYTAARAYLDGNLPLVYDGARFTAVMNERFADFMAKPLSLHPWLYPPTFLLVLVPFGLLPFVASAVLFQLATFAALAAALRAAVARADHCWILVLAVLLCPATPFNVFSGQNAFLSAALLLGGFALARRRAVLGGVVLGLLTIKPQYCLMMPLALVAARQWRTLMAATAAAGVLALLSLGIFGFDAWRAWVDFMLRPSDVYDAWATAGRDYGISMFAYAQALGASTRVANLAQGAAMAVAAGCTWWTFRRPTPDEWRLPLLLVTTLLAAPHLSASDALVYGIAAAIFLVHIRERAPHVVEAVAAMALWIVPIVNPPAAFRPGRATPLFVILFLACVMARTLNGARRGAGELTG